MVPAGGRRHPLRTMRSWENDDRSCRRHADGHGSHLLHHLSGWQVHHGCRGRVPRVPPGQVYGAREDARSKELPSSQP